MEHSRNFDKLIVTFIEIPREQKVSGKTFWQSICTFSHLPFALVVIPMKVIINLSNFTHQGFVNAIFVKLFHCQSSALHGIR